VCRDMAVHTMQRAGAVNVTTDFSDFYRWERPGLYRALALTLGDADLAAEAVDEALVRAYQRWGRIRRYDSPAGWVYRVALNWAISRTRRRGRVVPVAAVPDRAGAADPSLPDAELASALADLPEQQRAVVVLRYHLDWSTERVAAALGIPPGTVKSRLHRGLAALRAALEEHA
jgi:RNA polymerase sigma-70 factor (sigma-E family)